LSLAKHPGFRPNFVTFRPPDQPVQISSAFPDLDAHEGARRAALNRAHRGLLEVRSL